MSAVIYLLCTLTCLVAATLLLRAWQRSRLGMLFWSGLCFIFLGLSNFLLVLDRIILPNMDISSPRYLSAFLGLLLLLYGLIMESD